MSEGLTRSRTSSSIGQEVEIVHGQILMLVGSEASTEDDTSAFAQTDEWERCKPRGHCTLPTRAGDSAPIAAPVFPCIAKPLVPTRISEGASDGLKRRETLRNTVVGIGAIP